MAPQQPAAAASSILGRLTNHCGVRVTLVDQRSLSIHPKAPETAEISTSNAEWIWSKLGDTPHDVQTKNAPQPFSEHSAILGKKTVSENGCILQMHGQRQVGVLNLWNPIHELWHCSCQCPAEDQGLLLWDEVSGGIPWSNKELCRTSKNVAGTQQVMGDRSSIYKYIYIRWFKWLQLLVTLQVMGMYNRYSQQTVGIANDLGRSQSKKKQSLSKPWPIWLDVFPPSTSIVFSIDVTGGDVLLIIWHLIMSIVFPPSTSTNLC